MVPFVERMRTIKCHHTHRHTQRWAFKGAACCLSCPLSSNSSTACEKFQSEIVGSWLGSSCMTQDDTSSPAHYSSFIICLVFPCPSYLAFIVGINKWAKNGSSPLPLCGPLSSALCIHYTDILVPGKRLGLAHTQLVSAF